MKGLIGGLLLAGILTPARIALAQSDATRPSAQPAPAAAPAPSVPRPSPPTRDPHSPGYVEATELPDGAVPPPEKDGNFILGPTHAPAPETQPHDDVPKGTVHEFVLTSADSSVYPNGVARDPGTFGTPDSADPAKLVVSTSRPAPGRGRSRCSSRASYHEHLVPSSPRKPIRIWMHVGDRDLLNPNAMRDGMHDWVEANERMANALAARGYAYQFAFVRNAGHCDRAVTAQTLPAALEWLWKPPTVE